MHREIRTSSREILLRGNEEFLLTVSFSPSVVGCIDAIIRIRLIGTAMRHSVSSETFLFFLCHLMVSFEGIGSCFICLPPPS